MKMLWPPLIWHGSKRKSEIKTKKFVLEISEDLAGMRLDKALSFHSEIDSRTQATDLIDRGLVTKASQPFKPAYKTKLGENFLVQMVLPESSGLVPFEYKLKIVFEDDDLIVVNKDSGMVVHPALGHRQDTLVNALIHHTKNLSHGSHEQRPGIVHRIDKETSGLLVVAKTDFAHRILSKQFKSKSVHRIYWCVTYGEFKKSQGTLKSYLLRDPHDRKKFASIKSSDPKMVPTKGKHAVTHFKVIKSEKSGFSLVHCQLETGRTHQIRIHLSELGHPIVADSKYCSSRRMQSIKSVTNKEIVKKIPHLMLHAAELGFVHPRSKSEMRFTAPWPAELVPFIEQLKLK